MCKKQKMSTISISVFSADLKLIGFENRRELHLSCGLVNIARGNCNVIMKPDTNNINGEILISSERNTPWFVVPLVSVALFIEKYWANMKGATNTETIKRNLIFPITLPIQND